MCAMWIFYSILYVSLYHWWKPLTWLSFSQTICFKNNPVIPFQNVSIQFFKLRSISENRCIPFYLETFADIKLFQTLCTNTYNARHQQLDPASDGRTQWLQDDYLWQWRLQDQQLCPGVGLHHPREPGQVFEWVRHHSVKGNEERRPIAALWKTSPTSDHIWA